MGKKVVEKFWELKLIRRPQDIFTLNYDYISTLDGWGKLSTNNLRNSIENSKNVSLQSFIYSIGIRHIGIESAKIISENLKNISNFIELIKTKKFDIFLNVDGIGETQINSLNNFFSNKLNIKTIIDLNTKLNIKNQKSNRNGVLKNKTFMFTGKLNGISRAEAKSLIEKNSGINLNSVSKNLDVLVIGDKPTKRKVDQAKNLNIKIMSLEELKKLLD